MVCSGVYSQFTAGFFAQPAGFLPTLALNSVVQNAIKWFAAELLILKN
jgi:hypothetical protein